MVNCGIQTNKHSYRPDNLNCLVNKLNAGIKDKDTNLVKIYNPTGGYWSDYKKALETYTPYKLYVVHNEIGQVTAYLLYNRQTKRYETTQYKDPWSIVIEKLGFKPTGIGNAPWNIRLENQLRKILGLPLLWKEYNWTPWQPKGEGGKPLINLQPWKPQVVLPTSNSQDQTTIPTPRGLWLFLPIIIIGGLIWSILKR